MSKYLYILVGAFLIVGCGKEVNKPTVVAAAGGTTYSSPDEELTALRDQLDKKIEEAVKKSELHRAHPKDQKLKAEAEKATSEMKLVLARMQELQSKMEQEMLKKSLSNP